MYSFSRAEQATAVRLEEGVAQRGKPAMRVVARPNVRDRSGGVDVSVLGGVRDD